ncbi:MAG TPA: 4-hydroxy-tetrahydrodipicolinate synthase [Firmicutes bacterium]|nr:4-hydroxy-tetrahydrodipicolinate synthase [Bacillota bacterium]
MNVFGRVVTAMVTPMKDDYQVDYEQAERLASYLIENGSDGVLVCGTTGESPTVDDKEKLTLFRVVKQAVGRRGLVMAGTGTYNTQHSIELSREAERLGVDGLLLVVPYYNKPPQEGLYRHFKAIAESVDLPCMIYNIPPRVVVNLLPETLARLANDVPNIVAVKEASQNMDQVALIRRLTPPNFAIYSGDDSLTLPILSLGGAGVVSVASHLVGKDIARMIELFYAGRVEEAEALHRRLGPLFKALFITTNPIPVKWAMSLVGIDCGPVRLPLVPLSEAEKDAVGKAWADYKQNS